MMTTLSTVTFTLSSGVVALLILAVVAVIGWAIYRKVTAARAEEPTASREAPAAPATPAAPAQDDAIIAVITAAVAAALAAENGGIAPAFRVVSFKKVQTVADRNRPMQ